MLGGSHILQPPASRLGEEAWEEVLAEGRAMTLERAVANALGEGASLA